MTRASASPDDRPALPIGSGVAGRIVAWTFLGMLAAFIGVVAYVLCAESFLRRLVFGF